jgi:MipA family protein
MRKILALALISLTMSSPILAQSQPSVSDRERAGPPPPDDNALVLGFGGGIAPRYEGSKDYGFQPGGVIQGKVDGYEFQVRGTNLYVDLIRDKPGQKTGFTLGPVVQVRLDRTDRDDLKDPRVAALGKRKAAVELGGYIGIKKKGVLIPPASLSFDVTFLHDVSGAHKSFILTPSLSLSSPVSQRTLARIGVSGDIVGKGYGRTYFDVPVLTSPPPTFAPYATNGAGLKSIGTTLFFAHDLGGNNRKGLGLFALTGYKRLLGQYARSPIVRDAGDADQFLAVTGLAYSF